MTASDGLDDGEYADSWAWSPSREPPVGDGDAGVGESGFSLADSLSPSRWSPWPTETSARQPFSASELPPPQSRLPSAVDQEEFVVRPLDATVGSAAGPRQRGPKMRPAYHGSEYTRKAAGKRGKMGKLGVGKGGKVRRFASGSASTVGDSDSDSDSDKDSDNAEADADNGDWVAYQVTDSPSWTDAAVQDAFNTEAILRRDNHKTADKWKQLLGARMHILLFLDNWFHAMLNRQGLPPSQAVMVQPRNTRWKDHFQRVATIAKKYRDELQQPVNKPAFTRIDAWRMQHAANFISQAMLKKAGSKPVERYGADTIPDAPKPPTGKKATQRFPWPSAPDPAQSGDGVSDETAAEKPQSDVDQEVDEDIDNDGGADGGRSDAEVGAEAEAETEAPETAPPVQVDGPRRIVTRVRRTGNDFETNLFTTPMQALKESQHGTAAFRISKAVLYRTGLDEYDKALLSLGVLPLQELNRPLVNSKTNMVIPDRMNFHGTVLASNQCFVRLRNGQRCRRSSQYTGPFCRLHAERILGLKIRTDQAAKTPSQRRRAVPNGLVAAQSYEAGEVVFTLHGEVMSTSEMKERYTARVQDIPFHCWPTGNGKWLDMRRSNSCIGRLARDKKLDFMPAVLEPADVKAVREGRKNVPIGHRSVARKVNCKHRLTTVKGGGREETVIEVYAAKRIAEGVELVLDRGDRWRSMVRDRLNERDDLMYKRRGRGRPGLTKAGQKQARERRADRDPPMLVARRPAEVHRMSVEAAQRLKSSRATHAPISAIPRRTSRGQRTKTTRFVGPPTPDRAAADQTVHDQRMRSHAATLRRKYADLSKRRRSYFIRTQPALAKFVETKEALRKQFAAGTITQDKFERAMSDARRQFMEDDDKLDATDRAQRTARWKTRQQVAREQARTEETDANRMDDTTETAAAHSQALRAQGVALQLDRDNIERVHRKELETGKVRPETALRRGQAAAKLKYWQDAQQRVSAAHLGQLMRQHNEIMQLEQRIHRLKQQATTMAVGAPMQQQLVGQQAQLQSELNRKAQQLQASFRRAEQARQRGNAARRVVVHQRDKRYQSR